MKWVIFVLLAIIAISGCTTQEPAPLNPVENKTLENQTSFNSTKTQENTTENKDQKIPEPKTAHINMFGDSGCNPNGPDKLSVSPLAIENILYIEPQGKATGSHITPVDHQYWHRLEDGPYPVRTPADGRLIRIEHFKDRGNDWRLIIEHSCDLVSIFIHLEDVPESLLSQATFRDGFHPTAYSNIPLKAGDIVGYSNEKYNFDYSLHDKSTFLRGFISPTIYAGEPWKVYTVDPYDYFPSEIADQLKSKTLRYVEPIGGKIDFDQDGKLIGNWFVEGTGYSNGNDKYWSTHIAIVYDYIDPSQIRISLGDFFGEEKQFGVKGNEPKPETVTKSSGRVTYELVRYDYYDSDGQLWDRRIAPTKLSAQNTDETQGYMLVELLDNRRLRMELFTTKPTGFTENAKIYSR